MRIIAVNICGNSEPSEPSEPFTPIAPTSEVTSFRLGRLTDESIELHWRQPAEIGAAGIDGYKIEQQIIPGNKLWRYFVISSFIENLFQETVYFHDSKWSKNNFQLQYARKTEFQDSVIPAKYCLKQHRFSQQNLSFIMNAA